MNQNSIKQFKILVNEVPYLSVYYTKYILCKVIEEDAMLNGFVDFVIIIFCGLSIIILRFFIQSVTV